MKILVDTCVWSHALRHKSPDKKIIKILAELIQDNRVVIIGSVRQELLSGISDKQQYNILLEQLSCFEDLQLTSEHFIKAAEFCNICRSKGIQGANTDFLICAVAYLANIQIFTIDKDFLNYQKCIPVSLYNTGKI